MKLVLVSSNGSVIKPSPAKDEVMSNLKAAPETQADLDQAVAAYKEINAKIAFLSTQLKSHREVIEAAATNTPDGQVITEKYKITLSLCERENFDKKAAMAALGRDKLAPFLSTTAYTQLRVS